MNKYISDDVWTIAGIEQNLFFERNVATGEELVPRKEIMGAA